MKFYSRGGLLYGTVYAIWRGFPSFQAKIATLFYRRVVKECGGRTTFAHGVYIGYPGRVSFGENCLIGSNVTIVSESPKGELRIGDGVQISHGTLIDFTGTVTIGNGTLLSPGVRILSHDHGYDPRSKPERHDVMIENDVWIGDLAIILAGTKRIGESAIVGAGSIVSKPVPAKTVVAGNPARVIKTLDNSG